MIAFYLQFVRFTDTFRVLLNVQPLNTAILMHSQPLKYLLWLVFDSYFPIFFFPYIQSMKRFYINWVIYSNNWKCSTPSYFSKRLSSFVHGFRFNNLDLLSRAMPIKCSIVSMSYMYRRPLISSHIWLSFELSSRYLHPILV